MNTRLYLALIATTSLTCATMQACDCGSSSSPATSDAGTPQKDSGAPVDATSPPTDSGSPSTDGGACNLHLPSGYTQVASSAVDPNFGGATTMVLDENDDPMIAYQAVKSSVDTGAAPVACDGHNAPQGCSAVYFTRWDPCAGAFIKPILIDPGVNYRGANASTQLMRIAYDATSQEIGIVYVKTYGTDPNWADAYNAVMLATMKSGGTQFNVQQVSDNIRTGPTDVTSIATPTIAIASGKVYVSFVENEYPPCPENSCLRFAAESTSTDPDAGGEEEDGGGAVSHFFDYSFVPLSTSTGGIAAPVENGLALARDSAGNIGLAYFQAPGINGNPPYNTVIEFWRPGMGDSVVVTDTNNVQNDFVTLDLAFEGASPRVAGLLNRGDDDAGAAYAITYVSSTDTGATWNSFVPIVTSGGAAYFTGFAAANGNEAIISHYDGTPAQAAQALGCDGHEPFASRSANSGATFSGCELNPTPVDLSGDLSAQIGRSRITNKLVVVGNSATELLDGGPGAAIIYYQDP